MPTINDINDLNLKIAAAKTERDALANSIDPTKSDSWWVSLQNNCGATWKPNTSSPACSSTFKCTGLVDCPAIWNLITSRKQKIAELDGNITAWQGQVDALSQDPSIQQQLKDQEANRRIRIALVVVAISVAVIGGAIWVWKKYFKK